MSAQQRENDKRRTVNLALSILHADFARLDEQIAQAEGAGIDRIHIDVIDGHFVPNISLGTSVVRSLRRVTRLPLSMQEPTFWLPDRPFSLTAKVWLRR